jgi:hypothetical protein
MSLLFEQGQEQLVLAGEVPVETPQGHPGSGGNVANGEGRGP